MAELGDGRVRARKEERAAGAGVRAVLGRALQDCVAPSAHAELRAARLSRDLDRFGVLREDIAFLDLDSLPGAGARSVPVWQRLRGRRVAVCFASVLAGRSPPQSPITSAAKGGRPARRIARAYTRAPWRFVPGQAEGPAANRGPLEIRPMLR